MNTEKIRFGLPFLLGVWQRHASKMWTYCYYEIKQNYDPHIKELAIISRFSNQKSEVFCMY